MNECSRDDHGLSAAQVEYLLRDVQGFRVGTDGKGFAHMEQQDVRAHLTRVFGFANWDGLTTQMEQVFESSEMRRKKSKAGEEYGDPFEAWTVCYRAHYVLSICAPCGCQVASYGEWSTGEAVNQPSRGDAHDLAMKTAESQAMKRCATNLGDQFGLSLYNKGSKEAFVKFTLVRPEVEEQAEVPDPPAPTPESLERDNGMPTRDGITTNGHAPESTSPDAQRLWDRLDGKKGTDRTLEAAKVNVEGGKARLLTSLVEVDGEVVPLGKALDGVLMAGVS